MEVKPPFKQFAGAKSCKVCKKYIPLDGLREPQYKTKLYCGYDCKQKAQCMSYLKNKYNLTKEEILLLYDIV